MTRAAHRAPATSRRDWLGRVGAAFAGGLLAGPAWAADAALPVVGFLGTLTPAAGQLAPFLEGLAESGFVDGRTIAIQYRWAENRLDRLPALAAELVAARPAVIVTIGGTLPARAAQAATRSVPIVFEVGADPVQSGLVASLARPGGNSTGVHMLTSSLNGKRLQYLHEMVPRAKTVALLVNPASAAAAAIEAGVREAADQKGLRLVVFRAGSEAQIEAALQSIATSGSGAVVIANDAFFNSRREQLVAATLRLALPAVFEWRGFAVEGGLMSYGSDFADVHRQLGRYTARVLKGAVPAELPVAQPDRFELVINRRTATRLGLAIPQSLMLRAEVVE